jgi:hypothetical protein
MGFEQALGSGLARMNCDAEVKVHVFALNLETGDIALDASDTGGQALEDMKAAYEEEGIPFGDEELVEEEGPEDVIVEPGLGLEVLKEQFAECVKDRVRMPETPGADEFDHYMGYSVKVAVRLEEVLKTWPPFEDWKCFTTTVFEKFDCLYGLIIAVHKEDWEKYRIFEEGRMKGTSVRPTSLLEAYIQEARVELQKIAGYPLVFVRGEYASVDDFGILRKAASNYIQIASLSGGVMAEQKHTYWGGFDFFEVCDAISARKYEKTDVSGGLVLANSGYQFVDQIVEFWEPILFTEERAIRKLLELCGNDRFLVCDGNHITGLGQIKPAYDPKVMRENYKVTFPAHHTWRLYHGDRILMEVVRGVPGYPRAPFDPVAFEKQVAARFEDANAKLLADLVEGLTKTGHGTTVVISETAASEAERFSAECIRIDPLLMDDKLIKQLTAIDGAILLDPKCVCHAIGVILDGRATDKGDPGRGSRYNSAVRYLECQTDKCMIVVISDDGSVDSLPNVPKPETPCDFDGRRIRPK